MNKRVFLAINLPEEVKKEVFEVYSKKVFREGIKLVEEQNLHLTLKFLGYLSEEKINELKEKLFLLKEEKGFEMVLNGIGTFNGRVIWVGVKKGAEEVNALAKKIDEVLELRDERFHPHVTIARNKKLKRQEVMESVKKLKEKEKEWRIEVKGFELMESILSSKGPTYKKIFSIPLKLF
jgi:2'-5' RNA ligase